MTPLSMMALLAVLCLGGIACDQRTRPVGKGPLKPGVATTQGGLPDKGSVASGGERWSGPGLSWVVPDGWNQEGSSGMRLATLRKGKLEVRVTPLNLSPLVPNINRWRGQIGLAPATPEQVEKEAVHLQLAGGTARFTVATGETQAFVAAIVPRGDSMVSIFMVGEKDLVTAEAEAVRSFVQSIQFN